ncbi:MAG: formate/nitrite transporter family protein [Clostridiales bacterium]|nr:formate/nitrite transporter family protein [Clostridiales bacterium]
MMRKRDIALDVSRKVIDGIIAGILISLGGAVFLACYNAEIPYTKYVGAFLFSLALLCICMRGYALYTGKIGIVIKKHTKDDISLLLLCLLGNAIGTIAFGYLIGWVFPDIKATALTLCSSKLNQGYGFGLLRAFLCGILVYLSVDIYNNNKSSLGILLCIPAFILSGYEHSIADIFYFAASGVASGEAFLYLLMIIIGNSLGGLLIPVLQLVRPRNDDDK